MIVWCSYCQKLIGEVPPLTSFDVSHGMCARCYARVEAGEDLIEEHTEAIQLFRALFRAASVGDPSTCAALAKRAAEAGLGAREILVGLLQPALVEIGRKWESGEMSIADEHRFTAWCRTMMALLDRPPAPPPEEPLDILIVQAPGNRHEIGAQMAAHLLLAEGIAADAVVPDLPVGEIATLLRERKPAWLGISCSLPGMVEDARRLGEELVAGGFRGRVMLGGQALRRAPDAWADLGLSVCLTVLDARMLIAPRREVATVSVGA